MSGIGMKVSDEQQPEEAVNESEEDLRLVQANKLFQTGVLLTYGPKKSIDRAIKCIQKAITFNDSDHKYWQLLGEAYYQRGSLNPAINCFMKSLKLVEDETDQELDEDEKRRRHADCIYSRLRMSDIRLSVGHLDEASIGYSDIIDSEPNHVAALVGFARTQLNIAKNSFATTLIKSGHYQCMKALEYSLKAIKLCPHLCLTWKLASDCCLIQFAQGQKDNFRAKILTDFPGSENEELIIDRESCIKLATQFLCKALDIATFQESGCLWHNLGISLYLNSLITTDLATRESLLKRSIKCLLKSLDYDRDSSQIKNSLGVVAFNLNLLNTAQTFIIKSIQTNMSTSEIQFSNLGYMYLQKGEYRLASVAFSRCQAEEPLYARSWLGNSLINEQSNIDNLSYLRHCHKLESNYVSQLMFATKVVTLPCTEEYKRDLINALDCMEKVINYNRNSIEANNNLGLLYERDNHLQQARLYFDNALISNPDDRRAIFNKLRLYRASSSCFDMDDIDHHLGFIKSIDKLINDGKKEELLNYIYFLFVNSDYKNFNTKMTKFMDKLQKDDLISKVNSQILLSLAARAENSDFKSWLFKNVIELENTTALEVNINLLCIMLFATLEKDDQIIAKICDDLSRSILVYISSKPIQFTSLFYSSDGYWLRFTILTSIFCLKDHGRLVRSLVALFPTNPELWLFLGLAHMFDRSQYQTANFCIKKANLIGSECADLGFICDLLFFVLSQAMPSQKSSLIDSNSVKYLSRAIYKYPDYNLLWRLLESQASSVKGNQQLINEQNSCVFNLAIDHTLKMIRILS